ncbi:helix-turn-helix domain-containing protein [Lewinella sp. W8]|uniref:helix-turn-helix domain-containing protein n=1 Tax=Lewinella sp. W8 TaxID=2528208 RepID=UPI001068AE4B|nr:helix-turn-helix domain-containing protein [Lewinella sp. W8]MTB49416.1 helix-turn-helix domain-containing protein [Lewinella sp. W8]
MMPHSLATREQMVSFFEKGMNRRAIAAKLGVSYGSVCKLIKAYLAQGRSALSTNYQNCGRKATYDSRIYERAVEMKGENNLLGAGYILLQLAEEFPGQALPKERQLQYVFKRGGLQPQKTRRPRDESGWARQPLECVQVDAKERLHTADGRPCCYLNYVDEATGSELDAFAFPLRPYK